MTLPTVVITPGAWHTPKCFDNCKSKLESHGYKVITIHMPSVGRDKNPVKSLDEDIAAVRNTVLEQIEGGNDVVVVSHSWSGLPVSSALGGQGKKQREEKGEKGGVSRIAYISAFVVPEGVSLMDALQQQIPPWWHVEGELSIVNDANTFYNDMPQDQIEYWAKELQSHSFATKKAKSTAAAWKEIPSSYMMCELDLAIPIQAQEGMVAGMRAAGAEVDTVKLHASHSPFLSQPDRVVEYVRKAAGENIEVAV